MCTYILQNLRYTEIDFCQPRQMVIRHFLVEFVKYALALLKVKVGVSNRYLKALAKENSISLVKSESVNVPKQLNF